ncbi:hypothetical protein [Legionella fallonii]|nr:hypothetical protein [Legionella fallonii]
MSKKLIAKPSFTEMQNALPRIDRYIEHIEKINIAKIISGSESELLYAPQKMDQLLIDLFGNDLHQYDNYKQYAKIKLGY